MSFKKSKPNQPQEQKAPPPNSACEGCRKPMRKYSEAWWKQHEFCFGCLSKCMDAGGLTEESVSAWVAKGRAA